MVLLLILFIYGIILFMKKSREIIAGIGLGASLFGILPGCAAPKDARPEITPVTLPSPQPRIVSLASKLIDLSEI